MPIEFRKAERRGQKARIALTGPSGSGKTLTALILASRLGERIAVLDSEHGSASLYADRFAFDSFEPESYSPKVYAEAIKAAEQAGYEVLVIDSLSHAWMGRGGALEMVDDAAARASGNSFAGWKVVTPVQHAMIDAILGARLHVIVTMRTKTEYVIEDVRGKKTPRKVGLAPVQRDGIEYEFQIVGDLTVEHTMFVSKSRFSDIENAVFDKPDAALGDRIKVWLEEGAPYVAPVAQQSNEDRLRELLRKVALEVDTLRDAKMVDLTLPSAVEVAEEEIAKPDSNRATLKALGNKLGIERDRLVSLPDPAPGYDGYQAPSLDDGTLPFD